MSDGAERTFWRLQCHCDDEGRILASPRFIASKTYPHGPHDASAVAAFIDEWVDLGYAIRYEAAGKSYLQVDDFHRFQHPQKPQASLIPPPPGVLDKYATSKRLVQPEGKGRGGGGGGGDGGASTPHDTGQDLVREWVEAVDPPRRVNWAAAVKVLNGFLGDGWESSEVRTALSTCDAISYGWLNPRLQELRKPKQHSSVGISVPRQPPRPHMCDKCNEYHPPDEKCGKVRVVEIVDL